MIKNYIPQPYEGDNPMPTYVTNMSKYELLAKAPKGYTITLAKLFLGDSVSAGNPLAHALFESYTDHGDRAKVVRTRSSGYNRESIAVMNAMIGAGVEFKSAILISCETAMNALGEWFISNNPELSDYSLVMSQSCH